PAQLVSDARRHGVEVRPIDVNFSEWDCTLEEEDRGQRTENRQADSSLSSVLCPLSSPTLRLGFRLIRGLGEKHAEAIVAARAKGLFTSFTDVVRRTGLRAGALKKLGQADAFGSLPLARREALWRALPEREPPTLFDEIDVPEEPAPLPLMTPFAEVLADYGAAGLTLRQHPV